MDEKSYVSTLLEYMGIEQVSLEISDVDGVKEVLITVSEEESGMLIGRRGETIRALQRIVYLTFREDLQEKQLFIDVNGYRERRYSGIEQMAKDAVDEVHAVGSPITLPRLSADERRKVHMLLAESVDVETRSFGFGDNRRLTIFPKGYEGVLEEDEAEKQENYIPGENE